eukprot:jgi/Mesen1/6492/ME000331S05609
MPQMKLPAVGARISMDEDWLGSYMRVENAYWLSQMAAAQAVITEGPAEGADTCSMPRSGSDSSLADCVEKFVANDCAHADDEDEMGRSEDPLIQGKKCGWERPTLSQPDSQNLLTIDAIASNRQQG